MDTFRHPSNDYTEEASSPLSWLWALLFAPFYLLARGFYREFASFIGIILVPTVITIFIPPFGVILLLTYLFLSVKLALTVYAVNRRAYLRAGWVPIGASTSTSPAAQSARAVMAEVWPYIALFVLILGVIAFFTR